MSTGALLKFIFRRSLVVLCALLVIAFAYVNVFATRFELPLGFDTRGRIECSYGWTHVLLVSGSAPRRSSYAVPAWPIEVYDATIDLNPLRDNSPKPIPGYWSQYFEIEFEEDFTHFIAVPEKRYSARVFVFNSWIRASLIRIPGATGYTWFYRVLSIFTKPNEPKSELKVLKLSVRSGLALFLISLPTAPYLLAVLRRRRRMRLNHCLHCDYDLTGNESGVCPECGNNINDKSAQR